MAPGAWVCGGDQHFIKRTCIVQQRISTVIHSGIKEQKCPSMAPRNSTTQATVSEASADCRVIDGRQYVKTMVGDSEASAAPHCMKEAGVTQQSSMRSPIKYGAGVLPHPLYILLSGNIVRWLTWTARRAPCRLKASCCVASCIPSNIRAYHKVFLHGVCFNQHLIDTIYRPRRWRYSVTCYVIMYSGSPAAVTAKTTIINWCVHENERWKFQNRISNYRLV